MGTRADFYIKQDEELQWLGSIAWDAYPDGIDRSVLEATDPGQFKMALDAMFSKRDDVTLPDNGWPWPWNDSRLTDYAYVLIPGFGVVHREGDSYDRDVPDDGKASYIRSATWRRTKSKKARYIYPDMREKMNVRLDKGSGLIVVRAA